MLWSIKWQQSYCREQVYPLVEKLAGSEAGLVTGMILTLDISIVEEAVEEPEVELGSCGILLIVFWISGSLETCEQRPLQDRGVQAVEGEILWIGLRVLGVRRLLLAGSQGGGQAAVEGGQELWVFRWGELSVTRTRTRRTRAALYDRWPFRPALAWHFILGPYLTTSCEFLGFLLLPKA